MKKISQCAAIAKRSSPFDSEKRLYELGEKSSFLCPL
jgi:hypothetical protein